MRQFYILFIILFSINLCQGEVYTFHTEGNYTDAANWDMYPGSDLSTNDTISIEANCFNIYLFAYDGYIVFSEDVSWIGIDNFGAYSNCQIEIKSTWFNLDISVGFDYDCNTPIAIPDFTFIDIFNNGNGISSYNCIFNNFVDILYYNNGTQQASFLECMDGQFTNGGIIDVDDSVFFLNCHLDLADGTINSFIPFDLYYFNGYISQDCTPCAATINNLNNLYISSDTYIKGTVIVNGP